MYHESIFAKYNNDIKNTWKNISDVLCGWWRHQMETFSALLAICAGNSSITGEFLTQRPVTQSFDVIFEMRPNKRLSKQSWGWWFETPSRPLWHHCNEVKQTKSAFDEIIADGKNIQDHQEIADRFNTFFVIVGPNLASKLHQITQNLNAMFRFELTDTEKLEKILKS